VTHRFNRLAEDVRTVYAYVTSFITTNARDDVAQSRHSELQVHLAELQKLDTRYDAWVGSLDLGTLIERSPLAQDHAFPLRKAAQAARHQMSEPEEDLAASLYPSAGGAWAKLHGNVTSRLIVPLRLPVVAGTGAKAHASGPTVRIASADEDVAAGAEEAEQSWVTRELPMSAVRGLAHDVDAGVRRTAYEAELKGWEAAAVPLAAALNGVKGEVHTLNVRRGWSDDLEPALFVNSVDHATLDALHEACRESFADFRRYLRAKARLLGRTQLPWYDLFAPVGGPAGARLWRFDEAARFVVDQFGTYSPRLAGLAERAIRERWIDAEPRIGKRDGAFCLQVRNGESRVFLNYESTFYSVSTLAHELGHAYHNVNLAARTPMQRRTPMPLAETASIFCQTVVTNAALAKATGDEKLAILENDLQEACQVVVDIHSRFLFESRLFERRARRELTVDELNAVMLETQQETYGDGLDPQALHPYMWAVKPHYYSRASFYNWPYTFGFLFGLGLYARYQEDGERFRAGYDDLLSSTGLDDAAGLGQRFGIDVRSPGFWRASLGVVRQRIAAFEAEAARRAG
jgi:pepF/M3 family oligoendopeptidase